MGKNKIEAHKLALKFWMISGKLIGVCDRCNAIIPKEEGYICKPEIIGTSFGFGLRDVSGIPDLVCESCFDSSRTAMPFDREVFKQYIKTVEKKWWQFHR